MKSMRAHRIETDPVGYFRIFATPPGGVRREITIFRGSPIQVTQCSTGDPFSEQTAQISLPQVTIFDNLGEGDLDWMVPDCNIDIVWQNTGTYAYDWRWEGFLANDDFSINGQSTAYEISLKGALYGLDEYLAKPEFPKRPIPYEHLIRRAFDQSRHPAGLAPLQVRFPENWDVIVQESNDPQYLNFLRPWGVSTGQKWTGFVSRTTGSWDPVLTGHVQSMLTVMFAEGGSQWTVRNTGHRRPILMLREKPASDSPEILEVTLGAPGVEFSGSKDYTQRASVIYGSGTDDAGISYSGMQVSPDGTTTSFVPFAYSPMAYPRVNNPFFDKSLRPKEVMMQFQNGVSEDSARKIAQGQYHRFNDPGITGSLNLTTDLITAEGVPFPRLLVKAGATIRLRGMGGMPEGVLVHVTNSEVDFTNLSVSLTVDTKYRDELTVEEVRARTKDALTPLRSLQVGKYSNTVQDLILPWSYNEGSGCLPMGSREFFMEKLPSTAQFPYEEWTTQHPPSNPAYRPYYVRLNPTNTTNSTKNWAGVARDGQKVMSIPIRMAQAGQIRLSQIAMYDEDGHVLPVRFHVSVYAVNGVAADAMPTFPVDPDDPPGTIKYLKPEGIAVDYKVHQANPFYEGAWESVQPDGTTFDPNHVTAANANVIVGWGNYYEPGGYWPGRFSRGAERTGMISDTTSWSWDLSGNLDLNAPENNENEEYSGMLFVQIYCDEQGAKPAYLMGRFFRAEPGTT